MNVESRLLALEKANRRYRQLLTFVIGLLGVFGIMAFRTKEIPDTIQARNFEVVNDQNKVLARIGSLDGSGHISTFAPDGQKQIDLLPNNIGGGALVVYDGKGNMNARISYIEGGGGAFGLYNGNGQQVVRLGSNSAGAGDIYLRSLSGQDRVVITTTEDGAGSISMFNKANGKVVNLSAAGNQSGVLNLFNAEAGRICSLGTDDVGNGGLDCWNNAGTKTLSLPNN